MKPASSNRDDYTLGKDQESSLGDSRGQLAPRHDIANPVAEIEEQNRKLRQSLAAFEKSQSELSLLNRELEETNRGVIALYAELDDRAQEIQRVIDFRSRFLSNITHEFRTPLNSIIGLSRMLLGRLDGDLTTEQEKQARYINQAAFDLSELVNDLLDLARTESCKTQITPSTISVNELFATLRGMLRPLIEHNTGVTLSFEAPHPPAEIICDEPKLGQILRNLISNALKYTPVGQVHVSARIEETRIIFCVQDTGIGIPEEHQEKVFEEFYQVRNPLQQKTRGTGLGLALCRRLTELLGGGITLQSTVGVGSTFWVNLPLTLPPSSLGPFSPDFPREKGSTRLVLFVDDREENSLGYERLLKHTPYRAISAHTPAEALDILARVSVSAIVTTSLLAVRSIANGLSASRKPAPDFIVACDQRPDAAETASLVHAFLPASPRADQLLACLQKPLRSTRMLALVVDDNAAARGELRTMLEEFDLHVIEAGTAASALELIKEQRPSLVFTETVLPDKAGIAWISRLHEHLKTGSLIVHSSQVFAPEEREYLKQNTTELIRKAPVTDSVYRTAIIHQIARASPAKMRMKTDPLILVVDDNDHNRYVHVRHLERAGFGVSQASSGAECLSLAGQADLVVLDVRLPDMSGLDVCQQLRENPETARIPVLQTSAAFTAVGDRVVGLEQGADAYLCIPVEADELVATVRALLRTRSAELEAQRMAAEWQLTFDAIGDGICLLTEELTIARHNRAFSALANRSAPLIGSALPGLLNIDEPSALIAVIKSPTGGQVEVKSGPRVFSVRVDTVQSTSQSGGKVCIVSDITAVKATQESLRQAELRLAAHTAQLESRVEMRTRELHERNSELQAFTYSISHDLRAPLRTMHNFIGVLLEEAGENLTPVHRDYLQRIGRSAQRMDNLTIDMLHYSQLGRSELVMGPVNLQLLLQRLIDERKERTAAGTATATFELLGAFPAVFASEAGLEQALSNLLDNALKFTRPGVDTLIRCSARSESGRVLIQIEDNGLGIEPRHFKKIFLPFERLNPSQSVPGTGIGLAIVQRCLDKMGGEIGVSSVLGQGTTFSITLPAA